MLAAVLIDKHRYLERVPFNPREYFLSIGEYKK